MKDEKDDGASLLRGDPISEVNTEPLTSIRVKRLLDLLQAAYYELNEIHARDGVPWTHQGHESSVDYEYFSSLVDSIRKELHSWK